MKIEITTRENGTFHYIENRLAGYFGIVLTDSPGNDQEIIEEK